MNSVTTLIVTTILVYYKISSNRVFSYFQLFYSCIQNINRVLATIVNNIILFDCTLNYKSIKLIQIIINSLTLNILQLKE